MDIKKTRIQDKKEFTSCGHLIKFKEYYPETDTYVYERINGMGKLVCYEVVRPKYIKQDGVRIGIYPSSEDWGSYGLTVDNCWYANEYIDFLVNTEDWTPENRHSFKKTLKYVTTRQGIRVNAY